MDQRELLERVMAGIPTAEWPGWYAGTPPTRAVCYHCHHLRLLPMAVWAFHVHDCWATKKN